MKPKPKRNILNFFVNLLILSLAILEVHQCLVCAISFASRTTVHAYLAFPFLFAPAARNVCRLRGVVALDNGHLCYRCMMWMVLKCKRGGEEKHQKQEVQEEAFFYRAVDALFVPEDDVR